MRLLLLVGLVGQVLALRLLAIQLARSPDDPPLLRGGERTTMSRERRRRRHQRVQRIAIGGFAVATLATVAGLVALLA